MPRLERLSIRYDNFCKDAEELLKRAGLDGNGDNPTMSAKGFQNACVALASMYFPDDKEILGIGPRGLLWDMHSVVGTKGKNPEGARAVAEVLKLIIKNRPPIQKEKSSKNNASIYGNVIKRCPFYENKRKYKKKTKNIFVLMPFSEDWSDRIWNDHIKEYVESTPGMTGIKVLRADGLYGQGVMEDVYEEIVTSELIIAECTGRNPNVLYELGLCHALGKRTVLLSQSDEDIPFDLKRFRFCIYQDNSAGYPKLQHFIQQVIRDTLSNVE